MLTVENALDLKSHAGKEMGTSEWLTVTQTNIDDFAKISGDDHWIHVDVERAKREMPDGRTIVHGLYLISLIPVLQRQIYSISNRGRGLNYGYDKVRFVSPVAVDSRIRLKQTLVDAIPHRLGARLEIDLEIEIEGGKKPAMVARNILLIENP